MNRRRFIQTATAWAVVTVAADLATEQALADTEEDEEDEPRSS